METTTRPRLPVVLKSIRIATPCRADWDDMRGDARVRFCGKCEMNVYNLSAMTRAEGEALVREKEGRLCVRLHQRADGTVITSDCPVGLRRARLRARLWASISGAAASVALLLGLFAGRARADLSVDGKKLPGKRPDVVVVRGGAIATRQAPDKPKPPRMGEALPVQGDIATPPSKK